MNYFHAEDKMIRLAREHQEKINRGEFDWYCPYCDEYLEGDEVTFEETHDPRKNGCGNLVQSPPDPPYDHTGHDTLEEKYL